MNGDLILRDDGKFGPRALGLHTAYVLPENFSGYAEAYTEGEELLKLHFKDLSAEEVQKTAGVISGKTGLSIDELVEEIVTMGKHHAAGAFAGSIKNISGKFGEEIQSIIDNEIEPHLLSTDTENLGDDAAKRLAAARKSSSDEVLKMRRRVSIFDSTTSTSAKISSEIGMAASISSDAPTARTAVGLAGETTGRMASRSTGRALGHSAEASSSVVRAARNSRGVRAVASAASMVFRKNLKI